LLEVHKVDEQYVREITFPAGGRATLNRCRAPDAASAGGRCEQEEAGWRRVPCE
jgi:hypothetical protein